MEGDISYYKVLGVKEDASNHELRKAFCKLSIELHPDTKSLELEDAKSKFQKVLEAYENLNNINSRKIYDEKLKEASKKTNINYKDAFNKLVIDSNNQHLVSNRRPFSNGEMFSLFLLIFHHKFFLNQNCLNFRKPLILFEIYFLHLLILRK